MFQVLDPCRERCEDLWKDLYCLSSNIAEICKIKEVQQDDELMSKLYPIYEEIECFLTEKQKVDLSVYKARISKEKEEVAVVKNSLSSMTELVKAMDGLMQNKDKLSDIGDAVKVISNMSEILMQNKDKLNVSPDDFQKIIDDADKSKQQLENMCEKRDSTDIDHPKPQNTIEGQELPVTVQVGTAD